MERVIPCPDVQNGRVVKGVNFGDLRDVGDPAEQAAFMTGKVPMSWCSWIYSLP